MNDPLPISVVVLSHNEAANLPRCLRALRGCAEVVVVDDGSTDDSQRIAAELGARVVVHPFASFADQRNWALAEAGLRHEWTLHLDADEVVTPELLDEIHRRIPTLVPGNVGQLARKIMLGERWLKHSADYPVYVPRLIHRQGPRFVMRGHGETITTDPAASVYFTEPLLHYSFSKGWAEWRTRHQRYALAEAARIRSGAAGVSWCALFSRDTATRRAAARALSYRMPCRPMLRFVYAYILRLGFLDGAAGWRFCLEMAGYERMINAALRQPVPPPS
ncbi:MAG TPA: glycosyltransferase family 2 protein [Kiritimatiellia bacterium]|nr:glycosyltransferase family 2 protein [Kiritimatiellia bacterium]MBP9571605.1 glycosyltransferase family 2 protein [Kiritimatiellia bacterium]HQF19793.1 glycosyltransferase family 2 protein [Kiritimatiellia bacterium]HQG74009.1 glycosyltransferase family 2 protein [Kiritimatiellia bacterium]